MVGAYPRNLTVPPRFESQTYDEEHIYDDNNHNEALRTHFAAPTPPMASPNHSPRRTYTHNSRGESGNSSNTLQNEDEQTVLAWRERVKHFTWTFFTMTMATGQIANVLYAVPYRFHGLYAIGVIFFLLNVVLFIINVIMITLRFVYHPGSFTSSLTHPSESLFVPASVISIGTILLNITEYGASEGKVGPWLADTMVFLFWIYCALGFAFCCGIYLIMWSTHEFSISTMTPVWIFPCYPLLVVGPHAAILANTVRGSRGLEIVVGGFMFQGVGFMLSLMVYSSFLYRLMTQQLPAASARPGMFVSVGPSGFTIAGVVNMGHSLVNVIPNNFMGAGALAGTISMIAANWFGIWLWGLAIFFLVVSMGAHWSCFGRERLHFAMNWYSFIFPQTGLTTATFAIAKALNDNTGFRILGCIMTVAVVIAWFLVFGTMIKALICKEILWPQKQEEEPNEKDTSQQQKQFGNRQGRGQNMPPGFGDRRDTWSVPEPNMMASGSQV